MEHAVTLSLPRALDQHRLIFGDSGLFPVDWVAQIVPLLGRKGSNIDGASQELKPPAKTGFGQQHHRAETTDIRGLVSCAKN
jgi:hypothetical protein